MAPRRGAALTVPSPSSSLQLLLGVAREVFGQTARGLDPALSLSALATTAQAATALTSEFTNEALPSHEFTALWAHPGQDAAAYLALFALALRRSGPSGSGIEHANARILDSLTRQLSAIRHLAKPVPWGHIRRDLLAAAILGAGALECYSRLLTDTAEKLKPAAAAALAEPSQCAEGSAALEGPPGDAGAAAAGRGARWSASPGP